MTNPKILLISHNALSKSSNNGKTIEKLFSEFKSDNIYHLYLSCENEDLEFVNESICVHDYDALDNFFRIKKKRYFRRVRNGHELKPLEEYHAFIRKLVMEKSDSNDTFISRGLEKINDNVINRKPIYSFLRQSLWINKRWFMNDIYRWIDKINPEIVFFQGSGFHYSYDIVERIIDKYNLPLILQLTDDYTTPVYENSFIDKFLTEKYLKIFKRVIKKASSIITISKKMEDEYRVKYGGKNYYVMSNSANRNISDKNIIDNNSITILYAGNLGLNRWKTIVKLEKALKRIKNQNHYNIKLNICSGTKISPDLEKKFDSSDIINWIGFVEEDELTKMINECDFLLHVESFEKKFKNITRLSISTKIGEYLSTNRCIIAIGPDDIASIEFLKNNNLGIIIESEDENVIYENLNSAIYDDKKIYTYIKNAKEEYSNHFSDKYIEKMMREIIGLIKEYE